ncbi:TENA/THI domain-containing protein [Schizosaccharomyces japonicus yFS275]|uniref:TENA/THI domain-containing protein n=1 Tax=Schizosaccharomyces japonicus (strain yFS275 / FY16936) TaxID=402676 RepID=B6JZK7_SCHJY|nr:TENA/THI domain-containing protein [Schizosaccharomyces japonicus yFS275]EEB06975.1 TENA/THI domain-containing protein [Schizosaccharomyces japonicus yFS275]
MDAYSVELYKRFKIAPLVEASSNKCSFIRRLAQGKLPVENFDKWLFDDRLFVHAGAYHCAKIYVRAKQDPEINQGALTVLHTCYMALIPELKRFDNMCKQHGVKMPKLPPIEPTPEAMAQTDPTQYYKLSSPKCRRYVQFITKEVFDIPNLRTADLLYMVWLGEAIYHRSFATAAASPIFQKTYNKELEFVNYWGGRPFYKYVEELAYRCQELPSTELTHSLMIKVCEFEGLFWSSAEDD